MALIGNYQRVNKSCGRFRSGSTQAQNRSNFNTSGSSRGLFVGEANIPKYAGIPNGYEPPGSWIIPYEGGSLASVNNVTGNGTLSISSLSLGKACAADLTGSGTISSASLSMLIQLAANLLGSCSITANLKAVTNMTAALSGSGSVSTSLNVIAYCIASLTGSGSITGTFTGLANMSAEITPFTELSPQNLAAAVWEALATDFNTVGTMGALLNASGGSVTPEIIADVVLRRTTANVEASANGDPISLKSLYGMIAQGVHNTQVSGSTLTVTKSDDTTVLGTRTVTTSASAEPIVGIDSD